jgi:hypothetical protein
MRTPSSCFGIPSYIVAALGAVALLGTSAHAADLGPQPLSALTVPVDTWTGFSFAAGGGIGIFNANVNSFAKRNDRLEQCAPANTDIVNGVILCPDPANDLWVLNESFTNTQDLTISSLGDEGGSEPSKLPTTSRWVRIGCWVPS